MTGPILFLVPARGGSARIPGKNLRTVAGIPLVGHAVRNARLAALRVVGGPHAVVCSTDDPAIAAAARSWGAATIDRPAPLATASATSVDVAIHALDELDTAGTGPFRAIVLVQPTSPLTDPSDLVAAVERFDASGRRSVVSVTSVHPAAWHVTREPDDPDAIRRLTRDGDLADDEILTGAIYVIAPEELRANRRFIGPRTVGLRVPPQRSVDIDDPDDLVVAEAFARARPIRPVELAGHRIGDGPVFVIAEAGVNHDGRPELAHRLIDAAADAGADAVKFQALDPAIAASGSLGDWLEICAHARERGIAIIATRQDGRSAELMERPDADAYAVPADALADIPLAEAIARRGRPLLLFIGTAAPAQIAAAVDAFCAAGNPSVTLVCGPAGVLASMRTLRSAFGVPVGWFDCATGSDMALAATAAGASLVVKGLTVERAARREDRCALEPGAFAVMVDAIRNVETALGSGDPHVRDVESET